MTSEIESLKTNEFLRRRKVRLQQVREQSKDIAKKLRQRVNAEKLLETSELYTKKQKEYFEKQEKLVKRLEVLYARGLENVGVSHRSASEVQNQDSIITVDLSKKRAKEAAFQLRKRKQEQLDEQKRLLDRKLRAREAANEISREKSSAVVNKLITKPSVGKDKTQSQEELASDHVTTKGNECQVDQSKIEPQPVATVDMANQWDFESHPNEWEPEVPTLPLSKNDKDSVKESESNIMNSKSNKIKKLDLFALSTDMPSSLRGDNVNIPESRVPVKPALTVVSEYLKNRELRLREFEPASSKKKTEDLYNIKQIIQQSRASRPEGSCVCHVLEGQLIPVPKWEAESKCWHCSHKMLKNDLECRQYNSITNSEINKIFSSIRPTQQELLPSPVLRGSSPFKRSKVCQRMFSGKSSNNMEKSRSDNQDSTLNRKNSVTMYNHLTRNTRDIAYNDPKLVVRDLQTEEDAYAQAMKETSADTIRDKDHKAVPNMKNKIAMMKQNVEKEYKNTMNFLKSAPKNKYNKTMRSAYMDDRRQQLVKDNHQHILQQEYKKVEKECRKHQHCNKSLTKSPKKVSVDDIESRDFQYSWMPVPESDGNLAIHAIPTNVKEGRSGNTVKFSKIDSYHEYRSRHKHTPPTKDTSPEMDIIDKNSSDSMDSSTVSTDTSSIENLELEHDKRKNKHKDKEQNMSDAERIIIYKILETKSDRKSKKNRKLISDIAKSLTSIERAKNNNTVEEKKNKPKSFSKESDNRVSMKEVNEGVYKMVNEKGKNITSMYFTDDQVENDKALQNDIKSQQADSCSLDKPNQKQKDCDNNLNWECSDDAARTSNLTAKRKDSLVTHPSAATSATSFKTVFNDKPSVESGDNFIKLVDDAGQEAGKFYIGATGFLRDDAYEMVIQLRKKGGKHENIKNGSQFTNEDKTNENGNVQPKNDIIDIKTSDAEVHDILLQTNTLLKVPSQSFSEAVPDANFEPINTPTIQNLEQDIDKDEIHKTNFVDKAVCTSFNLSYAVSSNVPKTDPVTRPATSTCTQTTLSSPNHRPALYHMSSSTSTAYMSPPEMVLPKFLKQDIYTSDYDMIYQPIKKVEIIQKHDKDSHYTDCKNCSYGNNGMHVNTPGFYKKSEYESGITNTPPNTARSCTSQHIRERKTKTTVTSPTGKKTKFICQKCEKRLQYKIHTSAEIQKCKHNILGKNGTNRNINTRGRTSVLPRNKDNTSLGKKIGNSNLNPIIKQYVNRLLDLNREGLQVIEVVEQECSSVTTPGSSIINVPYNVDETKVSVEKKISLEQIKNILKEQIILKHRLKMEDKTKAASTYSTSSIKNIKPFIPRKHRLKPVHKVKSLNISKHLLKTKSSEKIKQLSKKPVSTSTTDNNVNALQKSTLCKTKCRTRSKSSPTPRHVYNSESVSRFTDTDITNSNKIRIEKDNTKSKPTSAINNKIPSQNNNINYTFKSHRATITSTSPDSESTGMSQSYKPEIPINMSTQTSQNIESEASFMKLAEDKLHNMEKIADLTEKCTQRLSNLAKVLEEVRKNKSLVYSQISTSDSTSDSDQKSEKPFIMPSPSDMNTQINNEKINNAKPKPHTEEGTGIEKAKDQQIEYTPFLINIPKPATLKVPNTNSLQTSKSLQKLNISPELNTTPELTSKIRPKPPTALSRIYLKHGQDFVVPHELSTVLEVDSPMSVKHKNQSARNDIKNDIADSISRSPNDNDENQERRNDENQEKRDDLNILKDTNVDPDLLQSNKDLYKHQSILKSPTESSDNSKLQMIDLKHFNQIMLEPFISIQEYAKQYNVVALDEGSNIEDVQKEDIVNDDVSSLHSDGSLPDVIAELLKRNIITEPFKFDTPSNANSTTISSESTISMLALSKVRKAKKQSNVIFQNKENIAESSDSLSISSNPDLENAFKKLGMGWASSTLKKTKERLALSSSSNTSSSSVSQFKIKKLNPDIPALITDSVSSVLNFSKRGLTNPTSEHPRNVVQQTSLINSMTVKEFLANELANKITFTNKSNRNETEEEFVSLFETKMPEEMKENHSVGSIPSGANNRARTSTPVQIFKSMTYHSSSSSNVSNGLFSNADDLSSVKMTSNSMKNHSTSEKDDLTVPNLSLRLKKGSDYSKSD